MNHKALLETDGNEANSAVMADRDFQQDTCKNLSNLLNLAAKESMNA